MHGLEEFHYNLRNIKYIINKVKVQINFLVIFNEKYSLVIFNEKYLIRNKK